MNLLFSIQIILWHLQTHADVLLSEMLLPFCFLLFLSKKTQFTRLQPKIITININTTHYLYQKSILHTLFFEMFCEKILQSAFENLKSVLNNFFIMSEYDLTSKISTFLDPHLILPLLEFVEAKNVSRRKFFVNTPLFLS
jgi:hypothetical protein